MLWSSCRSQKSLWVYHSGILDYGTYLHQCKASNCTSECICRSEPKYEHRLMWWSLLDRDKLVRMYGVRERHCSALLCVFSHGYSWWHLLVTLNPIENFFISFFHCQLLEIGKSSRADCSRVGHGEKAKLTLRTALIFLKEIVGLTWTFAGIQ